GPRVGARCLRRGYRGRTTEALAADVLRPHTGAAQSAGEILHERRGTAEPELGVERHTEIEHGFGREAAFGVEVAGRDVDGLGAAVADVGARMLELPQQCAYLAAERVLAAIARAVDPPQLALHLSVGNVVQHREDRGDTDTRADEDDRPARLGADHERSGRAGELHDRTGLERPVQVAAHEAVGFALDADAQAAIVGRARQRVAAHRAAGAWDVGAERHELTGLDLRDAPAPGGDELERADRAALGTHVRDAVADEARPRARHEQAHD